MSFEEEFEKNIALKMLESEFDKVWFASQEAYKQLVREAIDKHEVMTNVIAKDRLLKELNLK